MSVVQMKTQGNSLGAIGLKGKLKAAVLVEMAVWFEDDARPVEFSANVTFAPRFLSGGRIGADLTGHFRTSP